jgi:hypothetical protein
MTDKSTGRFLDWLSSHKTAVVVICLAVAGLYLFIEHNAHVVSILPYGLLLLCPFMHLLMHRGHGGHGENQSVDHSAHQHAELTSGQEDKR